VLSYRVAGGTALNETPISAAGSKLAATAVAARPYVSLRRDHRRTWISPDIHRARKVLFVSDVTAGDVDMFSLPDLTLKGTITGFAEPQGMCSDKNGNVWVADTGVARVYEYSHTGALLHTIRDGYGFPASCAIDPKNGHLTVLDIFVNAAPALTSSTSGDWAPIQMFSCPSCRPVVKVVPGMFEIYFGGYDKRGDLYVDGFDLSGAVQVGAVPRGDDMGHELMLSGGKIYSPGMVQWYGRGRYLAVGDQECNGESTSCIDWVSVSGTQAKIIGQTSLQTAQGSPVCDMVQSVLDPHGERKLLGGDYGGCSGASSSVNRWRYPAGGLPIDSNASAVQGPVGSAVSVK
jgi:hypothetical protein